MPGFPPVLGEAIANRCSQVLYRCLEQVGSTKGALYLRLPGQGGFEMVSFYGWPRGVQPPLSIPAGHPLLVRVQRERRTFVVNDASGSPELAAFGQGGEWPRFLITPIHLQGDWVGLLIQRDRIKSGTFDAERDEPPTLAICGDLVAALGEFTLYGAPPGTRRPLPPPESLPTAAAVIEEVTGLKVRHGSGPEPGERLHGFTGGQQGYSVLPWEPDRTLSAWVAPAAPQPERPRGMVPPEQRAFFWEIASLLGQILSASAVALWTEDPEEIRPVLAFSSLPLSADLQQQMLAHATFHLPGVREVDLRLVTRAGLPEAPELKGAFATYLPLLLNEGPQGHDLLLVFRLEDQSFSLTEIEAIQQLSRVLAHYLQEARVHERYHRAFLSVSHRILQSGEGRIPSLRPHSLATARLARNLALRLDLPTEEVEAVSIAAILHDVGLLLLDPQMLARPQLSDEEMKKVRSHPELASVFLRDLRFPFDVVKVIRHHHERWDGLGYPDRLRETAIPMGSRIIGLIEAYEVMTSGKSYRSPKGFRQVLDELRNESGSQFDPAVVEAFCELMTTKDDSP